MTRTGTTTPPTATARRMLPLLVVLAACGGRRGSQIIWDEPVVTTAEPVEPKAATSTTSGTASVNKVHALVGTWESARCGEREFPRVWEIAADGRWEGQDLVSPCPKGTTCMWSGIVLRTGTWNALDDQRIVLSQQRQEPTRAPVDMAPPTELRRTDATVVDELGCSWVAAPGRR